MQFRLFGLRLHEIAVLVLGVVVAAYAVSVIRDAGGPASPGSGADRPAATQQVEAPKAPTSPPALGPFRKAASSARTLLVIGDSTGAGAGAWVDLMARDLGARRTVSLHQWDDAQGAFSTPPIVYGSGRPLAIWNLSYPGVATTYPQRLGQVPDRPDAVILNIGHDRSPRDLARAARLTTAAVERRWKNVPTAWILQNPSTGSARAEQETAVARLNDQAAADRIPVIDVQAAFRKNGPLKTLLIDESHPNGKGSRLWADVVDRVVHGRSG